MTCKRFMRQIPLAVGQDLSPEQLRSFDVHLRRCLSCYREFRDYADALSALDPLRAPAGFEAPDGLPEAIMAEVRMNEPGPLAPHPTPIWSRSSRTLRYGLPAAAAVLVFGLAGLYVTNQGGELPGHTPQIPRGLVDDPRVVPVNRFPGAPDPAAPDPAKADLEDQLGPSYVFPERFHPGKLRLIGPVPSLRSEPLPSVTVPISKRNDF